MKLNEEQKLSLQAGEFIHTIANLLIDGNIKMENINAHRSEVIMEISEALRRSAVVDAYAPALLADGIKLSEYPRSVWIELATRLLDAHGDEPVSNIIKLMDK
ncbi:hypothetical protein G6Z92_06265 [Vibrio aestuarianus subsp. cardii]|uniref:hypothetical protein n=1 Tax=Vibrio aestuarianus TaxID=28171 RepID=UPI0015C55197|nr:hypothetical protein [Vibrio aestuarianus]NGZ66589.1 hypothetical protein [Vibrio aestuarianus subsp. cardii]